jgi:probable rRNA maturation factor
MAQTGQPVVSIYQRQKRHRVSLPLLKRRVKQAVPLCVAAARSAEAVLLQLPEVEVSILSDDEIAQVHAQFLSDPTPTDVITFHHGEVLVSADTAAVRGPEHGHSLEVELLLYVIHGLLHLAGWDDHEDDERREMHRLQQRILLEVMAAVPLERS